MKRVYIDHIPRDAIVWNALWTYLNWRFDGSNWCYSRRGYDYVLV